jgi:hypothetical protein
MKEEGKKQEKHGRKRRFWEVGVCRLKVFVRSKNRYS